MFKVSCFHADTFTQSIMPLIHCSVDNVLIKATPLFNQSFFQMIDAADLATLKTLSLGQTKYTNRLTQIHRQTQTEREREREINTDLTGNV